MHLPIKFPRRKLAPPWARRISTCRTSYTCIYTHDFIQYPPFWTGNSWQPCLEYQNPALFNGHRLKSIHLWRLPYLICACPHASFHILAYTRMTSFIIRHFVKEFHGNHARNAEFPRFSTARHRNSYIYDVIPYLIWPHFLSFKVNVSVSRSTD